MSFLWGSSYLSFHARIRKACPPRLIKFQDGLQLVLSGETFEAHGAHYGGPRKRAKTITNRKRHAPPGSTAIFVLFSSEHPPYTISIHRRPSVANNLSGTKKSPKSEITCKNENNHKIIASTSRFWEGGLMRLPENFWKRYEIRSKGEDKCVIIQSSVYLHTNEWPFRAHVERIMAWLFYSSGLVLINLKLKFSTRLVYYLSLSFVYCAL